MANGGKSGNLWFPGRWNWAWLLPELARSAGVQNRMLEREFVNPHQIIRLKLKDADANSTPWMLVRDAVLANRDNSSGGYE